MAAAVRPTSLNDLPLLANFLSRVYKFAPSDPHADTKLLEWKYLWPRPGWEGSRSYVAEKDGQIVAHCGLVPVTFCLPDGSRVDSLTMTDWAADPAIAGVGVVLFRKLMAMACTSFIIGGAPVTRQIVPRIGFRRLGGAPTYSAWLRPWREFRVRPLSGRSALRLLHGWTHPVPNRSGTGESWSFAQVSEFDGSLLPILGRFPRSWTACKRTLADLNYLLKCPHLEMRGFVLQCQNQLAGYFISGQSGWEARVLDLALDSENGDDWKGACSAITKAVGRDPEVCRIRVQATVPVLAEALRWNGYWCQGKEPLFVYDPSHVLDRAFPVAFHLFDGDAGY